MSRLFSTAARSLLKFIWRGMSEDQAWEDAARKVIENNQKLPQIEAAVVKGKPHKSKDPREHVSMVLYEDAEQTKRVTSVHVYRDGTGKYSKEKYD